MGYAVGALLLLWACTPVPNTGAPDTGVQPTSTTTSTTVGETGPGSTTTDAPRCNGSPQLCDRRLDQVTFAMTHNAMSSVEEDWWFPNQNVAVPTQLADGVRGISFDTHVGDDGEILLCHGYCDLGNKPLTEGLAEIEAFLADNPREVVVMDFESYITDADMETAFAESGLIARVHTHAADAPWATLGALIDAGEQVVVFSSSGGSPDWHHDMWVHTGATHWHFESVDEFRCDIERGDPEAPLYGVSHFLTDPVALPALAEEANAAAVVRDRLSTCWSETGKRPNIVGLDFYDIGDALEVIDELNALETAP